MHRRRKEAMTKSKASSAAALLGALGGAAGKGKSKKRPGVDMKKLGAKGGRKSADQPRDDGRFAPRA
jgi:hypothetical protein